MMKKFYLFLLTMMVSAVSAFAQIAEGNYYIQNVESGLFLSGNNSWGTQASATVGGDEVNVAAVDGGYTLIGTTLTSANKTLGYNLYVDTNVSQNGNVWTIAPVEGEDGVYTIYGKGMKDRVEDAFDGYIAQSATPGVTAGYVLEGAAEVTDAAKWRFLTADGFYKSIKAGTNVTSLLFNPGFTRNHATSYWTVDEGCTNKNLSGGANNNFCAESYRSIFNIHQTINVPNGTYSVTAQGFYRQDGSDNENLPVFYANGEEKLFPLKTGTENSMSDASNSFTQGLYTIEPIIVEVTDGKLTVGVKNEVNDMLWCIWDNFQVTCVELAQEAQAELVNADFADGVVGDVNIATYAKDGEVNQMQPVPGWEFGVENGDARAAGVVAYGSGTTLGGADYKAPAAGPEGTNGNALAVVGVWTGTVKYVQDVTLPAGKYTMTVPVYNTAGTNAFVKNLIGVKYGETEVLASTKLYPVNKWTNETVVFELAEETNVTVSLGYEGANVGSSASQHLFYDCVKLEAYDEVAVAKATALAALPVADASIFTPNVEDVEAVKAAIEAATTVEEVETAAATELAIPALSGEWQIKNANGEVYLGEAKLTATAISTTFEKAEGGFYINVSGKYVNFVGTGNNKWSMGVSETASTVWNFNLADGKYTIQGPTGLIGSDDLNDGSATYCDKKTTATDKNIFWTIEEYVEVGGWDGTISTNLEEKVLKDRDDIEGLTITFNGAKSIAVDEEGGYLALVENEDGWPILKVWGPTFGLGSTYSIDGETITLNGWINFEDVAADPDNMNPQTLLAKAKKVAKAPAADSWYVQDYGTFIIDGDEEPTYLDDIAVKHEEQGGWDGTVTTSLDEATITSIADFKGMTITLNGAKSIAILDEEECAYMALQNEDGSELYGIWGPTMGSTYTIEGNTITIDGFMPYEGETIDIPVGTTKLYIEDYGTLAIDGEGEYLPTMELNAYIGKKLAEGDYLILNTEYGKYLNGSNAWGTKASVTLHGQFMTVALNDGKYSIKSHYSNNNNQDYVGAGTDTYVDAAVVYHTITPVEGGYTIMDQNGKYLTTDGTVANFNGDKAQVWQFITKEEYIAQAAELASSENPVDMTALVPDADFSRNNTDFNLWTGNSKMTKGGPNNANGATPRGNNIERWGGNSTSIDFGTTVTDLPNGLYTVKFQGLYRYNNTTTNTNDVATAAHADGTEKIIVNFEANNVVEPFTSIANEEDVYTYGKMPFSQNEAAEAFSLGCYQHEIQVEVTDGTLTLHVSKNEADHVGCDWTVMDNIELYYLGEPPFYTNVVVWPTLDQVNVHFNAQTAEPTNEAPVNLETADGELVEENITVKLGAEFGDVKFCFSKPLEYGDYVIVINPGSMTFMYSHEGCAEEIRIPFTIDEKTTGINEINVNTINKIYTLSGVRVNKAQKGIYIINGKKVVIK